MSDQKSVLVAEDDKFLADAYRAKFAKEGFDVNIASDGDEAIAELKKQKPAVLLLDLIMPKKDGFAVLEYIRGDDTLSDLPVIIASNLGQKEDIDRGLGLGAKDFVIKSEISLDDLVSKVKTYLG